MYQSFLLHVCLYARVACLIFLNAGDLAALAGFILLEIIPSVYKVYNFLLCNVGGFFVMQWVLFTSIDNKYALTAYFCMSSVVEQTRP